MSKVKLKEKISNYIKIILITLVIILSTGGSVWARQYIGPVKDILSRTEKGEAQDYLTNQNPNVNCALLDSNQNILCSGKGIPFSHGNQFEYNDIFEGARFAEKPTGGLESLNEYTSVGVYKANTQQAIALLLTEGGPHADRASQKMWWNINGSRGGHPGYPITSSSKALGEVDFSNDSYGFAFYNYQALGEITEEEINYLEAQVKWYNNEFSTIEKYQINFPKSVKKIGELINEANNSGKIISFTEIKNQIEADSDFKEECKKLKDDTLKNEFLNAIILHEVPAFSSNGADYTEAQEEWYKNFKSKYYNESKELFDKIDNHINNEGYEFGKLDDTTKTRIFDYDDVLLYIVKDCKNEFEAISEEKRKEIIDEILKQYWYEDSLNEFKSEYPDFNEFINKLVEQIEHTKEISELSSSIEEFTNKYLDDEGRLNSNAKLSIERSDNFSTYYDEESQSYRIGPFTANYPTPIMSSALGLDSEDAEHKNVYSGLVGASLSTNDGNNLTFVKNAKSADEIDENQFSLVDYKISDSNNGYPAPGEEFYILVKYKEGRQTVTNFNLEYYWKNVSGRYQLYDGAYKHFNYRTEYSYLKHVRKYWKDDFGNYQYTYTYDDKEANRTWSTSKLNVSTEWNTEGTFNGEYHGEYHIYDKVWYTDEKVRYEIYDVTEHEAQPLSVKLDASVSVHSQDFGIKIPVSEQISVQKKITDNVTSDDTFHFLVAMESDGVLDDGTLNEGDPVVTVKDYMKNNQAEGKEVKEYNIGEKNYTVVNSGEVKAGEISTINLPDRYTDKYPDIKVIEVDELGQTYLEYQAQSLFSKQDSIWNKYTPANKTGCYDLDANNTNNLEFTIENTVNQKHGHIVIDKIVKKLPTIDEAKTLYFNVKLNGIDYFLIEYSNIQNEIDFDGSNPNAPFRAILDENSHPSQILAKLKLTDDENSQYKNSCGTIRTIKDGDYYRIVFVSKDITWYATEQAPNYSVVETDQFGKTYDQFLQIVTRVNAGDPSLTDDERNIYNNSVWNYYEAPDVQDNSGTIKECVTNHSNSSDFDSFIKNVDSLTIAKITNHIKPFKWNLDLLKENPDEENEDIVNFIITDYGVNKEDFSKEHGKSTQEIKVKTNEEDPVSVSHTINNAKYDAYFIRVQEIGNTNYLKEILDENEDENGNKIAVLEYTNEQSSINEFAYSNPGHWIVDRDGTGKIAQAIIYIDVNGKNANLSITAKNDTSGYTALKIEKEIVAFNEQNTDYPEEFYFKVMVQDEDGNYLANDFTNVFFDENSGLVPVLNLDGSQNENRKIVKVTRQDESSNIYSANSLIKKWSDLKNPPHVLIQEVDQYGYTYDEYISNEESRGNGSIWETYEELGDGDGQERVLKCFDTQEAVTYENATKFSFENKEKYKDNLTISKEVNGIWDNGDVFYIAIDVFEGLNLKDDEDFITKYFPNAKTTKIDNKTVIVLSQEKPSVTSEDIIWYSNEKNPVIEIYEVDQHGNRYPGSEENVRFEDSLWHKYTPTNFKNGVADSIVLSGSGEKIIEFENTSTNKGSLIITKKLTDGKFRENDEFYFKVFDKKGNDVTEKLFPNNVVDSKADLLSGSLTSSKLLKLDYDHQSATSIEVNGKHKYIVVEVDIFGVTYSYTEYATKVTSNGKTTKSWAFKDFDETEIKNYLKLGSENNSKIWGKDFIPSNNTGVWEVNVNETDKAKELEIKNIVSTSLTVEKDFVGETTDEEFTANLWISKNAQKYLTALYVDKDGDGILEEVEEGVYNKTIKIKKGSPITLDGIAWVGDAPIWGVNEIELPDGWMLAGYKVNDGELSDFNAAPLSINSKNKITVVNKQVSDDGAIQITKQLVDSEGNPKTLSQDFNALFEVYFNDPNINVGDIINGHDSSLVNENGEELSINGYEVKDAREKPENGDGYAFYVSVPVTILAGQSSATVSLEGFRLEEGVDLFYSIVEVDPDTQISYTQYKSGIESEYWKKTRPYKQTDDGKQEEFIGLWTGKITNKSKSVSILAQNEIKIVKFRFTKYIMDNKKQNQIPVGQKFYFKVVYNEGYEKYNTTEDFIITRNSENESANWYEQQIELVNLDDEIKPYVEEHDSEGRTYQGWLDACEQAGADLESDVWEEYRPFMVLWDGTANVNLYQDEIEKIFMNQRKDEHLVITKDVSNLSSEFYDDSFEFNFKVFEQVEKDGKVTEKDVTNKLFKDSKDLKDGYVVITKDNYKVGVASKEISKASTFVVREYDYREKGITYKQYKDLSVEERKAYNKDKGFWGKTYIPDSDGEYKVTIKPITNSNKDVVISAHNFKVTDLKVVKEVYGNISDADKDTQFPVKVSIKGTGKIWVYDEETALYKEYTDIYEKELKISANKPGEIKGIAWESIEAPKAYVDETLPDGWVLYNDGENDGYKNNGMALDSNNTVTLTVMNEKPDDVSLQITKNITDLNGNPTSLYDNDFTAKFEVYIKGDTESNIQVNGNPAEIKEIQEGSIQASRAGEGYNKYIEVNVTIPKSDKNDAEKQYTNAIAKITGLGLAKDGKIDYKVVEIDPETGIDYSQYKDSSNQTESSFWKKSKPSNGTGVWADSISKNDKGEYTNISVSAYDQIRNVNINFDKHVKDKDGKEVGLANGEKFYFNVEYDKYSDKNVTGYIIGKDENGNYTNELHENYTERFELLDLDEVINVKITETDGQGHTYGNCDCETSDVWSIFTPTDDGNDGIITKTVDANTDGDIVLDGYNQEKSNTLTIKKVIANSETTDFLDTEHFYFRVFEGDTDVTSKLFSEDVLTTIGEDKYIELNKDRQSVTSTTISRLHTYTIKEYDDKGFLYENREKSSSDFWKTGFVPANNGVWEVKITPENLSGETPAFKEAVNYRVVRNVKVQKELAESDVTDENKKKEFPVKVTIKPRTVEEKTTNIKFVDKDGNILSKEDLKDITANDDGTYTYEAKVSAEKAKSFPYGIIWDGPAPEWNAVEHDLPKGWTTVGYKVNDGQLTTTSEFTVLNSNGKNTIVIENEKDDRIGLKLTKKLVDSEGKDVTSVPSDFSYTAYFDIYLSGYKGSEYTIGDKTYNITEISSLETKPSTYNEEDGFTGYIRESITISGGNTSASKEMSGFSMKKGSSIKYKIVETDAEGRDYSNRGDSEFWKTSIPGNETGIWTGELKANDKGLVEITAQNKVRIISINFTKDVIITDLNGNETTKHSSEFADRENFYFNIKFESKKADSEEYEAEKYKSYNKDKYTINNKNTSYNETLYLVDWDDDIKVTVTETDGQGHKYGECNCDVSDVWSKFAPKDGKGEFTGECKAQTDANIELLGKNDEFIKYYGQLAVSKTVKDKNNTVLDNKFEQQKQPFYFVVLDKDGNNVVNDLFENSSVTIKNPDNEEETLEYNTLATISTIGENGEKVDTPAIEVHAGQTVTSKVIDWMSNEENPVYKVKEVDQFNQTYNEFTKKLEENKEETLPENLANSIWNDYKSTFGDGEDVKLEAMQTPETVVVKTHAESNTFIETYKFGWDKKVNGGGMIAGENFYFQVRRNTTDSTPLGKEALQDLFPELKSEDIDDNNSIHFHVDNNEDGTEKYRFDNIESRKVEIDEKYYVTEVDASGNAKTSSYDDKSLWNTYTLDGDGTFEFSRDTDNYQTVNNKLLTITVNISKVLLPGQSSDRDFKFKLYINEELFKDDGRIDDDGIFTVKANETQTFSFELGSVKEAPQIDVEEVDGNLEKILVNGKTYTPFVGTEDGLVYASTDKDSEFTFEFTNDVEHKGLLNLEKIITDGKSDVSEYSNKEYNFEYTYTRKSSTDNSVIESYEPKTITVKPQTNSLTEVVTWYDGEYVEFTLKEIDKDPEDIIFDGKSIYNKEQKIATGIVPELTEEQITDLLNGKASEDTNNTAKVSIINHEDWLKLKLKLDKLFTSNEKIVPSLVIDNLINNNENIDGNSIIKFNVKIRPDGNSKFRYKVNDKSIYKDADNDGDGYVTVANVDGEKTELTFSKEITLGELKKFFETDYNNPNRTPCPIKFTDGGEEVVVEYLETENRPIIDTPTEDKIVQIQDVIVEQNDIETNDDTITFSWSFTNKYDGGEDFWDLTTTLAGMVWEDGPNANPEKGLSYTLDGIYDIEANPYDKPLEGITVKVIRQIIDEKGNVVKETPNSDAENFIYGTTSDVTYTNEGGQWSFDSVSVPAFTSNDKYVDESGNEVKFTYEDGYRVKYDVEFYYDGIKYEPTELLATVDGDANKYIEEVRGKDPREVLNRNSTAEEVSSTRDSLRSKYATVEADPNDPEMKDDYSSKGKIKGANGEETDISYAGQLDKSTGKVISKGTVNYGSELSNYVKATTSEAGLRYFFTDYKFKNKYDKSTSPKDVEKDSGIMLDEGSEQKVGKTHYHGIYNYATHINLGLKQREQADLSVNKSVAGATVIVNKNHKIYTNYNGGNAEIPVEFDDELLSVEKDNAKLNIYTSDYYYRVNKYAGTDVYKAYNDFYRALFGSNIESLIKTNELQVYFTYRITVNNESKSYSTKVESIEDYSDSKLTYVDVKTGYNAMYQHASNDYTHYDENGNPASGLWAYVTDDNHNEKLTNLFEGREAWYNGDSAFDSSEYINDNSYVSNEFNKAEIIVGDIIDAGKSKDYYVVYRVNLDETDSLLDINDKYNYAEISSFTALESTGLSVEDIRNDTNENKYVDDGNNVYEYAGVIDTDSAPGNFRISMPFEDDTDYTKASMSIVDDYRSITGTAMLDNNKDGYLDDKDVKLPGITTKLVEVIDLPNIDEDGNVTNNYTEYEFYDKETVSGNDDGAYEFSKIVAGNYIVRFMYGDKSTDKINDDLPIINGVDYKTTTYEKDQNNSSENGYIDNEWLKLRKEQLDINEARDNEARRLALIEKTQRLNNKNTSIFDVANYNDQDEYVNAKQPSADLGFEYNKDQLKNNYSSYKAELFKKLNNNTNGTTAYNSIIDADGYAMFADTAKVNLKVNENTNIGDMNLGLELRPETKIYLDKQVKEITLTDSSGTEFFHVNYDIYYYTNKDYFVSSDIVGAKELYDQIEAMNKDAGVVQINEEYYEANKVTDGLYVALVRTDDISGIEHLLEVNDSIKKEDDTSIDGYKYINVDSQILQGLDMKIKYQLSAINLGEADYYGNGLDKIINGNKSFTKAIDELSSSEYYLASADELNFRKTGEPKKYGEYLGHAYYEGEDNKKDDKVVTTTVHQIVDYVDNNTSVIENENANWNLKDNNQELNSLIDSNVFVNGKIITDLSKAEDGEGIPYADKHIAISQDSNIEFVKELTPLSVSDENNPSYIASTTITTFKKLSATDDGDTSVSNLAEILEIENIVGRRDRTVVYGNYDPRGGAKTVKERDETSAELVSLSPPTGSQDNDRVMAMVFGIIGLVTLLSGGVASVVLRVSNKKKKAK